ncbi:MAG: chemotaxis protein CheB [Gemmatimonadota bacterium]
MTRDLVVVGCSAGGLEALIAIMGSLPTDLPAAVLVVQHSPVGSESMLPAILARSGPLPASAARDAEPIGRGRIYTAPSGSHLIVEDGILRLSKGPRENGHRPAVDPLFRSAARAVGPRAIGVVLSGTLDDGAIGLRHIKTYGGLAVVQSPEDAAYPDMPRNAIATVSPDFVAPASEIATLVDRIAREPIPPEDIERAASALSAERSTLGSTATMLSCPECGGTLRVTEMGGRELYRCHSGHAYSELTLEAAQNTRVETALSHAYRALVEQATILRRLAERSRNWGHGLVLERMEERAREAEQKAAFIHHAITGHVKAD